jgi:hypothetical protein
MIANLLAVKTQNRAFPMERLFMPRTTLTTLKKVAFTLLCCTVLMVFSGSAQTPQQVKADPGANQGPPAGAILDLNGTAIPPSYQQYTVNFVAGLSSTAITFAFRNDPSFTSFANASVVDITNPNSPGPNLLVNGDFSGGTYVDSVNGVVVNSSVPNSWIYSNMYGATYGGILDPDCGLDGGNCWYDGAVQAYDAISQTIPTNIGDTYEISFYVQASGGTTFSDISTNGNASGTGGNGIDVTVYAQAGLPPPPSQDTLALTLTGLGAGNVTDTSYPPVSQTPINCAEAGGGVAQTGVCSETDAPGTMVTLTQNPGSTAAGLSSFGGWGGACASYGTSPTCTVPLSSAQVNVTASFVAPSTPSNTVTLPFNPGTNVTQNFVFCPNGSSPCTDPNATAVTVLIPTVYTAFDLTVLFTEFSDNGLCPPGGTVTSNFACRFGSFFNYGTDPNNNTIAPLCDPYLNGDCVQYLLYWTTGGPGTVPPAADYSGGVNVEIGFANTAFAPTSYWTGSTLRMIDDPDSYEFPPLPFGTNCSDAMQVGTPPTQYSPTIYCQFVEDVTTFLTPGPGLDPIGSKIPDTNNLVVAFLPTSTGTNPVQQPPAPTPPTLSALCVNGCVIGGDPTITFTEGTGGTFQVTIPITSPPVYPAPTLTESGTLPNGLTFNSTFGTISGTPADGSAGNYFITFNASNGVLPNAVLNYTITVSTAPLTITASNGAMTYGGTPPTITPTFTGLVNGDTPASLGTVTCTTTATSSSPVGSYPSSCSASDPTYTITFVPGTVTVGPAPLTIAASSATMTYGGTVPTITPTFTGLVNGDSTATLGVTCTTTATSTSLPGSYPSSCTASHGTNYTITYVNGTVTVVGLELSASTVNFGTLYQGQIGIQEIILKNTSTGSITISSINLAGGTAPGDYGDLSFCPPMIVRLPATLPAGKSCAIGLGILASAKVFSPTPSTTTLTIVDSAASQAVLLTALVINPQAAFSSTYLNSGRLTFPTTLKGNSNQQTITVTNPGNTPLILGNPAISVSSSSGYFTLTSTTCNGATVDTTSEGGVTSCAITVTFAPKGTGTFTGTVRINDNAWNGPQFISLSGTT